jgi:hypothetical protein
MSLFTSQADSDLPLLSQFYQVDAEDTLEMNEFVVDWIARLTTGGTLSRSERGAFYYCASREIKTARWLHALTRGLLDDLADNAGGEVRPDLFRSLFLFRQRMEAIQPDWIDRSDPKTMLAPERMLSQQERRELAKMDCYEAERAVWRRLVSELWALCQEPERVRRCTTCRNPYVVKHVRDDNQFCSRRCQNKAQMRRKREGAKTTEDQKRRGRPSSKESMAIP